MWQLIISTFRLTQSPNYKCRDNNLICFARKTTVASFVGRDEVKRQLDFRRAKVKCAWEVCVWEGEKGRGRENTPADLARAQAGFHIRFRRLRKRRSVITISVSVAWKRTPSPRFDRHGRAMKEGWKGWTAGVEKTEGEKQFSCTR